MIKTEKSKIKKAKWLGFGLATALLAVCVSFSATAVAADAKLAVLRGQKQMTASVVEGEKTTKNPSSLFSSDSASITANAALPEYIEKLSRPSQLEVDASNAPVLNGSDVTAVKIRASEVTEASIKFNNIVDLSFFDPSTPIIEVLIAPDENKPFVENSVTVTQKDTNFGYLDIELTDVYDPNNTVTLTLQRRYDFYHMTSGQVATSEQAPGGWVDYRGYMQKGFYGTPLGGSFAGSPSNADGLYRAMSFTFDYAESRVYASPSYNRGNDTKTLVRGLKERKYLLDGDSLWNGFTTGEVYMNIKMRDIFKERTATVYILSAAGIDVTGSEINDTQKPLLREEYEYDEQRPLGEIGLPYPFFNTVAYDYVSGKLNVEKKAYYDYTGIKTPADLTPDGTAFIPNRPGKYTLEYTATDEKGLSSTLTIDTDIAVSLNPLYAEPNDEDFFASVKEIGEKIVLPNADDLSIFGGSGRGYTVTRSVTKDGREIELGEDNVFVPVERGYYRVVYNVKDYLSQTFTVERLLKVDAGEMPQVVFPYLPEEAVKGKSLLLPKFVATDYRSFGAARPAKTIYTVQEDDSAQSVTVDPGSKFTPKSDTAALHIVAKASNIVDGKSVERAYTVSLVEPNGVIDYFRADENVVKTVTESGEAILTGIENTDAEITFLQPLMRNITFKCRVPNGYGNYELVLHLQDAEVASTSCDIKFVADGAGTSLRIGDTELAGISGAFAGSEFTVSLIDTVIKVNGVVRGDMRALGFNGFDSDKVFLTCKMNNVSGVAQLGISGVNNQTYFGGVGDNYDNIAPTINTSLEIVPVRYVGEIITVPTAKVFDVLDTETTLAVSVTDSKNSVVFEDKTGTKPFVFRAEKPEVYTIQYVFADSSLNVERVTYTIRVLSTVKPTITLSGKLPSTAMVGTEIKLPKAEAKDAFGNSIDVKIFVIDSSGNMAAANDTFKPTAVGTYTVRYYAVDGSRCTAIYDYYVKIGG